MYEMVIENKFAYDYFKDKLTDKAWNLSSEEDIRFLEQNKMLPIKIQNMAIVQNGIATNKDSAYIVQAFVDKALSKLRRTAVLRWRYLGRRKMSG